MCMQILHYHPAVCAAYQANMIRNSQQLGVFAPVTAPGSDVGLRQQFLMVSRAPPCAPLAHAMIGCGRLFAGHAFMGMRRKKRANV